MVYASSPDIGVFELRNYQTIRNLIKREGIDCEWKSLPGCHAFFSQSLFETAVEYAEFVKNEAPELGHLFSVVTPQSTNPSLADLRIPHAVGALVQKHAASLWPYKLVTWILENLLSQNESEPKKPAFNLQTNTPVTHLQKVADGWIVHTSRGMLATKTVLLTTNAYTSHLLPIFSDLIIPVRGEMTALQPPKSVQPVVMEIIQQPLDHSYVFIGDNNQDEYLIQRPFSSSSAGCRGGELMFGGARNHSASAGVGISDDSKIDLKAHAYLRNTLNVSLDLHNNDMELKASHEWSGIMGYSKDHHPWVGQVKEELGGGEGLWISAGFTGHGMPNACLCAKAVVEMILETEQVELPGGYQVDEYRATRVRGMELGDFFYLPQDMR